jgi:hypothetical protein
MNHFRLGVTNTDYSVKDELEWEADSLEVVVDTLQTLLMNFLDLDLWPKDLQGKLQITSFLWPK